MKNLFENFKNSSKKTMFYYIGYIREDNIYISCSISKEYEDCYNCLMKFIKEYEYDDISHGIYIKQISEDVVNEIAKAISSYNYEGIKNMIVKNNENKDYRSNFERHNSSKFLRKTEDGFEIINIRKKK